MTDAVRYDEKAERQLDKLPREVARRIVKRLGYVGATGRGIEPVKDEAYGFKVRVGDYRVLADVSLQPPALWVRVIDHRSRICKRL